MTWAIAAVLCAGANSANAQSPSAQEATALPEVMVTSTPSAMERNQVPGTTEGIAAAQMAQTINVTNTEDALKYLPSLIVRKRNFGDQFAPVATRTSGLGQSARALIYADGLLLSTLIGNNNGAASPRWGLVGPEEIERIDVMYGPFSAAYPGNSMGAVVDITTRMPKSLEAGVKAQGAMQAYSLYGTRDTYKSDQLSTYVGSRTGDLSWFLSANHLDSQTQPVNIITVARPAAPSAVGAPANGAYMDQNRLGQPIAVIGSGGLEHKRTDTLKAKLAYDFTPEWRGTYTIGQLLTDAKSRVDTYLRDSAGRPVYSGSVNIAGYNYVIGASSFSSTSGFYNLAQQHTAQSVSLVSNMQREWDWEAVASNMHYGTDSTRVPTGALPTAEGGGAGTLQSLDGTGWSTLDLKGSWRPTGPKGPHQVSFGLHADRYKLANTTSTTTDWVRSTSGAITAQSFGNTSTEAIWVQDAWRFAPQLKLTVGGRQEFWRAFDGFNYSQAPLSRVSQPTITANRFSPKAALTWEPDAYWRVTGSYGTAYRFPTVTELYQAVTVAGVVFTPNPNLRPERAYASELAVERAIERGRVRASLFSEDLADALISQNSTIAGTNTIGSSIQNVARVRTYGIELVADKADAWFRGLDLSGSFTWVDSKITSNPNFRNAAGVLSDVVGKYTPNIPRLKMSGQATYRYDDRLSGSLGARYSDRVWATMDNTDINPDTYQGFDKFFVVDARVHYKLDRQMSLAVGVDNLNNRKYFLFHPFPQRTLVAELKVNL